jgi:hypothetical protein
MRSPRVVKAKPKKASPPRAQRTRALSRRIPAKQAARPAALGKIRPAKKAIAPPPEAEKTLWDWLTGTWKTPRIQRAARLAAAALLAALGVYYLATEPGSGNWILLFIAAVIFLVLGLRLEVPEEPLPLTGRELGQVRMLPAPPKKLAAPSRIAVERPPFELSGTLSFLRLPIAAILALSAQWVMTPMNSEAYNPYIMPSPQAAQHLGWFLYIAAFVFLAWAILAGDVSLAFRPPEGKGTLAKPPFQRIVFLVGALLFGLLAYSGFYGGRFRLTALLALGIAVIYWLLAFAELADGLGVMVLGFGSRFADLLRKLFRKIQKGITLSPWSLLLAAVFAGLVFLRTVYINAVPPEMTSDHMEKLINVADVLEGRTYIFFANNGGREPLEMYIVALVSQILGTGISFLSLKIVSIAAGIATLPFLYLLGKELVDRRVGLLAMVLGGVGYWPDMISRLGLRLPLAMLFSAATLYFFYKALRRRRWNDFLWAGLALGIGMYGYTPIRVLPIALIAITLLFLLHPSSKGSRLWAVAGLLLTGGTVVLLFIPMLRYAVDNPNDFWLRTVTRIVPQSGNAPVADPLRTFFGNLRNAAMMFSWNNGVGWFNCVPLRPALDVAAGALFHLGVIGMAVQAVKKYSWEAISLVVILPILLLPSILALAIPNENPSLARAIAAVPVVYLLPAIMLVLLIDYLRSVVPGGRGRQTAALVAGALIFLGATQDFKLTWFEFPDTYRGNVQNASELGAVLKEFSDTIGRPEDAYIIPYPYWVDDRLVNINAGFPIFSVHYVFPEDIPNFVFSGRPTVFLLLAKDEDSLCALQQRFPNGYYRLVHSAYPEKDFIVFLVPGTPAPVNTGNGE